jgi:hypothetical protein
MGQPEQEEINLPFFSLKELPSPSVISLGNDDQ